jgi:glutamate 5-kinase
MIHADYLFLFTDVDGLYTANPRKDSSARLIEVVESTVAIRAQGNRPVASSNIRPFVYMTFVVSTATLGSSLGTGGMETKLIAAEIATAAGVSTIITSSRSPASLFAILEYHGATSNPDSTGTNLNTTTARPPHTLFMPSTLPLRDLKTWTRHTLTPAGAVVIDSGAHSVLARRESGGRLLAAGVIGVRGAFASGQAVRILVRKRAAGVVNSEDIEAAREEYVRGLAPTEPGTPLATETVVDASLTGRDLVSDGTEGVLPEFLLAEGDTILVERDVVDDGQWVVEEVGRGLANYNSAQVDRVKGLNRCVPCFVDSHYHFWLLTALVAAPTWHRCWGMQIPSTLLRM